MSDFSDLMQRLADINVNCETASIAHLETLNFFELLAQKFDEPTARSYAERVTSLLEGQMAHSVVTPRLTRDNIFNPLDRMLTLGGFSAAMQQTIMDTYLTTQENTLRHTMVSGIAARTPMPAAHA